MKWMLVIIVMNSPVKTDLVFGSLAECLSAEAQMRQEWADHYGQAKKAGAAAEILGLLSSQVTKGTCIPAK